MLGEQSWVMGWVRLDEKLSRKNDSISVCFYEAMILGVLLPAMIISLTQTGTRAWYSIKSIVQHTYENLLEICDVKCAHTHSNLCRPILDVAEFWHEDKISEVKWMFEGELQTNQDMKLLVDTREDALHAKLGPVKALIAGMPGCKSIEKLSWVLTQFDTVRREMEEIGKAVDAGNQKQIFS